MYLSSALLLLWLPGCFSRISGPPHKTFTEDSNGIIKCHYEAGWENYVKWWCRGKNWSSCKILVKTTKSEQEKEHMSIQDDPRERTITVTIKNIRKNDEDFYWCGIEKSFTDLGFMIKVDVVPATTSVKTVTITKSTTTNVITSGSTESTTGTVSNYSNKRPKITDLQVLLPIIFGILLVMVLGFSVLAWRMAMRLKKGSEKPDDQVPQPTEEGISYATLNLQKRTFRDSPLDSLEAKTSPQASSRVLSVHQEVEYVSMASLKEDAISYATLSLHRPGQNSIYSNMELLTSYYPQSNPSRNTEYSL